MSDSKNVVPLHRGAPHLTCTCGSAWWDAKVCFEPSTDDPSVWKATGYRAVIACAECGHSRDLGAEASR